MVSPLPKIRYNQKIAMVIWRILFEGHKILWKSSN